MSTNRITWMPKFAFNGTNQNETTTEPAPVLSMYRAPLYAIIIIAIAACALLACCSFWMGLRLCYTEDPKKAKSKKRIIKRNATPSPILHEEEIQPDLDELDACEAETQPEVDYIGKLHHAIEYSPKNLALTVTVIEACDLPAMDIGGTSDPYVKVRLLPDKKPFFCTKVIKANCNPLFSETFTFEVLPSQVANKTVFFDVFDYDSIGKDDTIGYVTTPLSSLDLSTPSIAWSNLVKPNGNFGNFEITESLGEICVSLRYAAAASLLTVVLVEAKNLPVSHDAEDAGSFVKLALYHEGKRLRRKRSTVRKSCRHPYFNETFTFRLPYQHVAMVVLDVSVFSRRRFLKSKRIGFIEIGLGVASAPQSLHWSDMIANQRHSIARWHKLRSPGTGA